MATSFDMARSCGRVEAALKGSDGWGGRGWS
jgi:hypothetical protein